MRRLYTLICCFVMAAWFYNASAQSVMQVWKDGKVVASFETSQVDSVTFTQSPYQMVDLGLPSGTLWCAVNVGALLPSDTGDYYAWGETTTKTDYSMETSKWYGKDYDKDTALVAEDDIATQVCGADCHIPTPDQFNELFLTCQSDWTSQTNSAGEPSYGYLFTGPNGNQIFLPAAGYYNLTELISQNERGSYWTNQPDCANNFSEYISYLIKGDPTTGDYLRSNGCSIRPVSDGKSK